MWSKFRKMASNKSAQTITEAFLKSVQVDKEYNDIMQELIDNGVNEEDCRSLFDKIGERREDFREILIFKYRMPKNEADYLVGRIIDNYNDISFASFLFY